MNIDRAPNVPKRSLTSERLLDEASRFANGLAAGRWKHQRIQEVQLTRKIVESFGDEYEVDEHSGKAIFDEVTISFSGLKRYVDTKNGEAIVSTYLLTSTTSQDISIEEMPANVLGEILKDASEEGHILYVDPEESDVQPVDLLGDFEIQRNQEVAYEIDEDGELGEYTLRYFYTLDGDAVHETKYSNLEGQIVWNPIILADGTVSERKLFVLPKLNEANIEDEAQNIDASFEKFLSNRDIQELAEFSALPKEEHIRRVLGMIGMVSGGFVGLRKR